MKKYRKIQKKNEIFFIHSIFLSHVAWSKRTHQYVLYISKYPDVGGALMIEALIWIYINYSEKMKILKKNEILIIHPIYFSRDTYDL